MNTTDCDVLVVGAGPTGLTLALQLLARGVRTRVIDKDTGLPKLSRAIGLQPRTLETLDMMGIVDRFLELGHRGRGISVYLNGRRQIGIDMNYCDSEYRFVLHLPQNQTEEIMRARLVDLGGAVESGMELVDFDQDSDAVTATVRDLRGDEHQITASFLVGCDGAHSKVRKLLDVPFIGQPYPWDWLLADAELEWTGRNDEVHVFWGPGGRPLACIPINHRLWRISAPVPGDRGGTPPTLEEIQTLVDARGPGGIVVRNPETLTSFRCQIRSTDTYRRNRVFLAGDAAHIHAPTGAQGMNLGINDAANLGWKLALVLTGQSPDTLLDSYAAERGPAAQQVLTFTETMVRFAMEGSPLKRTLRRAALPLLRLPRMKRRLAQRISQLTIGYQASPITRQGHVADLPEPGARMPNIMTKGRTLHAALRDGEHVLVGPEDGLRGWVLVRPDGYVAAVGPVDDTSAIDDYLREVGATVAGTGPVEEPSNLGARVR